ncbi:Uncharacterized protein M6B38_216540 [Iris pallida]|uniref:Uncharacterized protein n=1 Tax=Iris pallida TaxID=29817 RepID=A0AAX6DZT6_IRIPA|nr:Uncharacterized protein M6B38_216540 [Iris pallida]
MDGISTIDGFINVKEEVEEMIKYIANEPSVGLFFVQQHARSSMPCLLGLKDKVVDKVNEVTLHTEDTEDSIYVVKSMTECGIPIADDMIKDIIKSLQVMSASQPKRGLLTPTFGYSSFGGRQEEGSSRGYLSSVLNSAKQRAAGLRWPKGEELVPSTAPLPLAADASSEAEELPVSSTLADEGVSVVPESDVVSMLEDFDKFRFERESKLEQWLQEEEEK